MFWRLNYLTYKQWIMIETIQFAKHILPYNWYLKFIKFISNFSQLKLIKNLQGICPPSKLPQVASICFKVKNFLSR